MTGGILLTLMVPQLLEDNMVDWLMLNAEDRLFLSGVVSAHAAGHERLSLMEQVTGRRQQIRFDVLLEAEEVDGVLKQLKQDFKHTGIRFWMAPLHQSGEL